MGTGTGLARQQAQDRVFGRAWNRTEPFFRSKPRQLAGYPDPLLTLIICHKVDQLVLYQLNIFHPLGPFWSHCELSDQNFKVAKLQSCLD